MMASALSSRTMKSASTDETMDPNRIKRLGTFMAEVRSQVEPLLLEAGFQFLERNKPLRPSEAPWIDYARGPEVCRVRFDVQRADLTAELLQASADCTTLAVVPMNGPGTQQQLLDRIADFREVIRMALAGRRTIAGP
jgi:hypothetical protein